MNTSIRMSVTDCANYLGISKSAAWRLVKSGQLPSLEIGKRIILNRADVDDFIARHTRPAVDTSTIAAQIFRKAV